MPNLRHLEGGDPRRPAIHEAAEAAAKLGVGVSSRHAKGKSHSGRGTSHRGNRRRSVSLERHPAQLASSFSRRYRSWTLLGHMAARSGASSANTMALWILAVLGALFFLRAARTLLIPIAMAVLISYALEPLVSWLERHRVHRYAGTALVMLAILAVTTAGAYALRDDVKQVAEAVPQAAERARDLVTSKLGVPGSGGRTQGGGGEAVGTSGEGGLAGGLLQRGVGAVIAFGGHLVVVFFLIFFLLIAGSHVRNRIVEIAGRDAEGRRTMSTIIDDINGQIQRYLLVLLATAVIVGVATWVVLAWMNVQHAAMWGMLAGIFNSIPYFGPVIVSGGLFVVGLVQGGGLAQAIQMSGAAVVITSLEGWLIAPPLMGKAERMSALAVFLGLLLWTWLWGGWGTILAVPMLVVIKSIADHVDRLRPVGRLMAP
jgi:predicted PurR-regulated permease PerM